MLLNETPGSSIGLSEIETNEDLLMCLLGTHYALSACNADKRSIQQFLESRDE